VLAELTGGRYRHLLELALDMDTADTDPALP
jgi:hypothetical protein